MSFTAVFRKPLEALLSSRAGPSDHPIIEDDEIFHSDQSSNDWNCVAMSLSKENTKLPSFRVKIEIDPSHFRIAENEGTMLSTNELNKIALDRVHSSRIGKNKVCQS